MHPRTDIILKQYADPRRRLSEVATHSRKMENGLRVALRELERLDNTKDGHPLVSHTLMNYLRDLLA
jgi:hypothetical protein